ENGAQCLPTEDNSYARCICRAGYSGPKCADKDHCYFAPCKNGGSCAINSTTPDEYKCDCLPNYSGQNCEDFRACSSSPCAANSECTDTSTGEYECGCAAGWQGRNCDQDVNECQVATSKRQVLCQNGGTCVNTAGSYECACLKGTGGFGCATNPDDCNGTYEGPDGMNYTNLCIYLVNDEKRYLFNSLPEYNSIKTKPCEHYSTRTLLDT
ncbi:hypothetical protein PENTCL1PPCAC_10046, partial [Pristionchus entomophagus]